AELRGFHAEHSIQTQAWSPLGRTSDMIQDPVINRIAEKHSATASELVLSWYVLYGSILLPASSYPDHKHANLFIYVILSIDDVAALDGLERGRMYQHPAEHEEF